jgi:transposase
VIGAVAALGGEMKYILGIDVSKDFFDCVLLSDKKQAHKKFENRPLGFEQLSKWLRNHKVRTVHACLEATGGYGDDLAYFLYESHHRVSVVNPSQVHNFGKSELSRTKTDASDAALIARFCQAHNPQVWEPPTPSERLLRQLVRRKRVLVDLHADELRRKDAPGNDAVEGYIDDLLAKLSEQISQLDREIDKVLESDDDLRGKRNLIESVPGIGPGTSSTLLAEVPHISSFESSKALAAFAGVCPQQHQSGSSIARSHVTHIGNRSIRRMLYMAAASATRHNPVIREFAQRLRDRGKAPMQIRVAAMRKLVVLVYGVLKTGQPFDPAWNA